MCKPVTSTAATLVPLRGSASPAAHQTGPADVAATAPDCALTYAELDRWSNRLARMLLVLGARPGTRVAIADTPQLEAVVSRLAITKTGATPVPLLSETTSARVDFGITTKAGRDRLTDASHWLVLDERSTLLQYLTGSDAPLTDAELHTARMAS
ncbi:AMP-binding protein [Nocardia yamanashiensis]|uniref:AMP-binding protein n=1 Tax=Nocardia yamanashiensis TaxID=209247 RepID=UPI00082D5736|nr:AMP-binding protein [Nocardia yamanashiensis]UGT42183.1 AMP-binding protein [Nocardia yamanashiensis]